MYKSRIGLLTVGPMRSHKRSFVQQQHQLLSNVKRRAWVKAEYITPDYFIKFFVSSDIDKTGFRRQRRHAEADEITRAHRRRRQINCRRGVAWTGIKDNLTQKQPGITQLLRNKKPVILVANENGFRKTIDRIYPPGALREQTFTAADREKLFWPASA